MCYGRMRRKKNRRLILEAITMSRSNVEKEQAKEGREKRERKRRQYALQKSFTNIHRPKKTCT